MYKVIECFHDRKLGRCYQAGEDYPGGSTALDKKWAERLAGVKNRLGRPVIALEKPLVNTSASPAAEARAEAADKTPRKRN